MSPVSLNTIKKLVNTMKLRTQFSIPVQTSEVEQLKKPNPPSKQAKKRAKFRDKAYVGTANARL